MADSDNVAFLSSHLPQRRAAAWRKKKKKRRLVVVVVMASRAESDAPRRRENTTLLTPWSESELPECKSSQFIRTELYTYTTDFICYHVSIPSAENGPDFQSRLKTWRNISLSNCFLFIYLCISAYSHVKTVFKLLDLEFRYQLYKVPTSNETRK